MQRIETRPQAVNKLDLAELFQQKGSSFSKINRRIADYILKNYQAVSFMTAREIAQSVGVSQASVSRFIGCLGFDGFSQFSETIQEIVRRELKAPDRLRLLREDQRAKRMANAVAGEIDNLKRLLETINLETFSRVVDGVVEAENVAIIGVRASKCLAEYFAFYLSYIHPRVVKITEGSTAFDTLLHLDKDKTLCIAICFPRYPRETVEIAGFLNAGGFSLVSITDSLFSPVIKLSDMSLEVPLSLTSVFDNYAVPMTLINLIILEVVKRDKKRADQMLERFEKLVVEGQHIFSKGF